MYFISAIGTAMMMYYLKDTHLCLKKAFAPPKHGPKNKRIPNLNLRQSSSGQHMLFYV